MREAKLGVAMIFVGVLAALAAHPLFIGAEELTRWDTVTFGNKTALFFLVLILIGAQGGLYCTRAKSWKGRVAVIGITATLFLVSGWAMSMNMPFDIAPA